MQKPDYDEMWKDPKNWKAGGFYYNPQDDRILVPKKIPWMGATINFGHKLWFLPLSPIIFILLFVILMAILKN